MLANANETPIEQLQSALAYLMTRYSSIVSLELPQCSACCALTVVEQIKAILAHPEVHATKSLRDNYLQLLRNWELLSEHQEANHPANQSLMAEAKNSGALH
ncbi:hypothetical protein EOL70_10420 [Leucothrix sargassi]|nr:hypothetical protein EOL70_10420 [Leucothrix sargassi]